MGLSYASYIGDGSTTDYAINFALGYLHPDDIHVYVDGTEVTYTFINVGMVRLNSPPATGSTIDIRRITDTSSLEHDYQNGAVVIDKHLDESNKQAIMAVHEIQDGFINSEAHSVLEAKEAAEDSAQAAADSAQSAADSQAVLDEFNGIYAGALVNPPADPDEGDLYFDLTTHQMMVYINNEWKKFTDGTNIFVREAVGVAGSTVIAVPYSGDALIVILNGYVLPKSEFLKHDGTSITVLNTMVGDEIQVLSFASVTVDTYYTQSEIDARFLYGFTEPPSPVGLADGTLYFKYKQ